MSLELLGQDDRPDEEGDGVGVDRPPGTARHAVGEAGDQGRDLLPDYPITGRTAPGVLRPVATVEPAVGFALAGEVDSTVNVVSIAGRRSEDERYPLAATGR